MSETLLQRLDKAIAWHDERGNKDIAIQVDELRACAERIRELERAQHAVEAVVDKLDDIRMVLDMVDYWVLNQQVYCDSGSELDKSLKRLRTMGRDGKEGA